MIISTTETIPSKEIGNPGIKKFAESIPGGCGCDHRKEWFNKNFPYNMNKK